MELTEEQKERIKNNREKALAIRKRKLEEEEEERRKRAPAASAHEKAVAKTEKERIPNKRKRDDNEEEDVNVEVEAFEEGASEFVTKQEAMKMYCLPQGTLECCEFVEKPNPRNGAWNKMKLYKRSEIRRRARQRFGGLMGLQAERQKRRDERFRKDMEKTKDCFR